MINIHKISYVMPLVDGTRQSLIILIVIGLLLQYFYIRSSGMWSMCLKYGSVTVTGGHYTSTLRVYKNNDILMSLRHF